MAPRQKSLSCFQQKHKMSKILSQCDRWGDIFSAQFIIMDNFLAQFKILDKFLALHLGGNFLAPFLRKNKNNFDKGALTRSILNCIFAVVLQGPWNALK